MATKRPRSNIYFEVILPLEDDSPTYGWTLYKGKQRIISEGTASSIEEARQAITTFKYEKGILT